MNEASLGTQSAGAQSDDTRRYLMQLPPALFRARLEVESEWPRAFAQRFRARAATQADSSFSASTRTWAGLLTSEAEAQRAGCDLAVSLFWREEFMRESLGARTSR